MQFNDISIRRSSNSKKCMKGHISVKDSSRKSLLPNNLEQLCNASSVTPYTDFNTIAPSGSDVEINHRGAEFKLTFSMESPNSETTSAKASEMSTSSTFASLLDNATLNMDEVINHNTTERKGIGHIIGIGCGSIFVLIAIIAALIFLKRRKKSSERESQKQVKKHTFSRTEGGLSHANSIGSINNAMYGQVLDADEAKGPLLNPINQNDASVHFQNGNTIFSSHNAHHLRGCKQESEIARRDTRPKLPSPPTKQLNNCPGPSNRVSNLYERIEEMKPTRSQPDCRPISYASFTSDEFTDDDAAQACTYASILNDSPNFPKVSNNRHNTMVNTAEYNDIGAYREEPSQSHQIPVIVGDVRGMGELEISSSTPHLNTGTNVTNIASKSLLTSNRYAAPRPSLPAIHGRSLTVLAEDAENYLSPRPSCPDIMAVNGYSSTSDISDLRQRLLQAAHPSLLQNGTSIPENVHYDSPGSRNGKSGETSVQYATPKRRDKT